jgi:hypothetical protein
MISTYQVGWTGADISASVSRLARAVHLLKQEIPARQEFQYLVKIDAAVRQMMGGEMRPRRS